MRASLREFIETPETDAGIRRSAPDPCKIRASAQESARRVSAV
jgi:hypothetical protein